MLSTYIFDFGEYNIFKGLLLLISSLATFLVFTFTMMDSGIKMFEIKKLKQSGFVIWCLYITPGALIYGLGYLCYKLVLRFNKWLDNE